MESWLTIILFIFGNVLLYILKHVNKQRVRSEEKRQELITHVYHVGVFPQACRIEGLLLVHKMERRKAGDSEESLKYIDEAIKEVKELKENCKNKMQ